jgi:hypothetical protein
MAQSPKDKQSAETPPQRRGWAVALGEDAGAVGRSALGRAGFDDPTLVLRWEEIAGAETARLTRPLRLSGDVLTLRAEPGAAVFLQHESRPLCERINTYLGRTAVSRLKFVPGPVQARPRLKPRITPKAPVPTTDPAQRYEGPERLREALLQLAQARRSPH